MLRQEREIDSLYDTIIRMNRGYPQGKEKYIGSRTDVLALSMGLNEEKITKKFNPKMIFWMTPKYELMTDYIKKRAHIYPIDRWHRLYSILEARPTTGCMLVDWVVEGMGHKADVIGFDFFKTGTWYWDGPRRIPHKPDREREYIESLERAVLL